MHRVTGHTIARAVAVAACVLALGAGGTYASAQPPADTHMSHAQATERTVVRPVTSHHRAAHGWHVHTEAPGTALDCYRNQPSIAAVNNNVDWCGATADNTPACWRGPRPKVALCINDVCSHKLIRRSLNRRFPRATAPKHPRPLLMTLANGLTCTWRVGGAGPSLPNHPGWAASYYCNRGKAVWTRSPSTQGVNMTHPRWTVHIARDDGKAGALRVVGVRHGWFVGTRH